MVMLFSVCVDAQVSMEDQMSAPVHVQTENYEFCLLYASLLSGSECMKPKHSGIFQQNNIILAQKTSASGVLPALLYL